MNPYKSVDKIARGIHDIYDTKLIMITQRLGGFIDSACYTKITKETGVTSLICFLLQKKTKNISRQEWRDQSLISH